MKKIVKCLECGKEMELYPSSKRKFCSISCTSKFRSKQTEHVKLVCEQCGKEYYRTARYVRRQTKIGEPCRFCSIKCKEEYWGRNRVECTCPVCGKTFLVQAKDAGTNKCCSPECSAKNPYFKGLITLVCQYCGKEFQHRKSYIDKQEKRGQPVKYCSRECSYAGQGRSKQKLIKTQCKQCGKIFAYKERAPKKFCSEECRLTYAKRNTVTLTCKHCGKTFKRNGYHATHTKNHYCCIDCKKADLSIQKDTYAKLQHYLRSSTEYSNWQKAVFAKAHYICENCGRKQDRLHAHHKYELYNIAKDNEFDAEKILTSDIFNDVNNGECLCIECHIKRHPYHRKLRDKLGRFCRREFKTTDDTHDDDSGIKLEGE